MAKRLMLWFIGTNWFDLVVRHSVVVCILTLLLGQGSSHSMTRVPPSDRLAEFHWDKIDCRCWALMGCIVVLYELYDRENFVLAGLPASTLAPFQRVLHAAARTVLDLKPRDRVTLAHRELHWLPVASRWEDPVQVVLAGSQVASGTRASSPPRCESQGWNPSWKTIWCYIYIEPKRAALVATVLWTFVYLLLSICPVMTSPVLEWDSTRPFSINTRQGPVASLWKL